MRKFKYLIFLLVPFLCIQGLKSEEPGKFTKIANIQGNEDIRNAGDWTEGSSSDDYNDGIGGNPGSIDFDQWGAIGLEWEGSTDIDYRTSNIPSGKNGLIKISIGCVRTKGDQPLEVFVQNSDYEYNKVGEINNDGDDGLSGRGEFLLPAADVRYNANTARIRLHSESSVWVINFVNIHYQKTIFPRDQNIAFGDVKVGESKTKNITIGDHGYGDYSISYSTSNSNFDCSGMLSIDYTGPTSNTYEVPVTFTPQKEGQISDQVNFDYPETDRWDFSVSIEGRGIENNTSPTISITSGPANNDIINTDGVTFSWDGDDPDGSVNGYEYELDGKGYSGDATSKTFSNLSEGEHTFKVRCIDDDGSYSNYAQRTFYVEKNSQPSVSISIGPSNGDTINTDEVTFNWNGDDPDGSVNGYEYELDGKGYSGDATSKTFSNLSEGEHTFKVRCIDDDGSYSNYAQRTFYVDKSFSVKFNIVNNQVDREYAPNIRLKIYSNNWNTTLFNSISKAGIPLEWNGIDQGEYKYEIIAETNNKNELWGLGSITISKDQDIIKINRNSPFRSNRHLPYGSEADARNQESSVNYSIENPASADQKVYIPIEVKNNHNYDKPTRVKLYINSSTDYKNSVDKKTKIINANSKHLFVFQYKIPSDFEGKTLGIGTEIEAEYNSKYRTTDISNEWYKFKVDAINPKVTDFSPARGEKKVPISSDIFVYFNKDMDKETINKDNFFIKGQSGKISGELKYIEKTDYLKFMPNKKLKPKTKYSIHVTSNIKDVAGNSLDTTYSWSFITKSMNRVYIQNVKFNRQNNYESPIRISPITFLHGYGDRLAPSAHSDNFYKHSSLKYMREGLWANITITNPTDSDKISAIMYGLRYPDNSFYILDNGKKESLNNWSLDADEGYKVKVKSNSSKQVNVPIYPIEAKPPYPELSEGVYKLYLGVDDNFEQFSHIDLKVTNSPIAPPSINKHGNQIKLSLSEYKENKFVKYYNFAVRFYNIFHSLYTGHSEGMSTINTASQYYSATRKAIHKAANSNIEEISSGNNETKIYTKFKNNYIIPDGYSNQEEYFAFDRASCFLDIITSKKNSFPTVNTDFKVKKYTYEDEQNKKHTFIKWYRYFVDKQLTTRGGWYKNKINIKHEGSMNVTYSVSFELGPYLGKPGNSDTAAIINYSEWKGSPNDQHWVIASSDVSTFQTSATTIKDINYSELDLNQWGEIDIDLSCNKDGRYYLEVLENNTKKSEWIWEKKTSDEFKLEKGSEKTVSFKVKPTTKTDSVTFFLWKDSWLPLTGFSIYEKVPLSLSINREPKFTKILSDTTIKNEKEFIYKYKAEDPDNDELEYLLFTESDSISISEEGNLEFQVPSEPKSEYEVTVKVTDQKDTVSTTSIINIKDVVAVYKENSTPNHFTLNQNYPNPFNPTTTIIYGLPERSKVNISIFDIQGRQIKTLIDERQNPGYHRVKWNAKGMPTGMYFYRMKTKGFTKVKKCLLVK